MKNFLKLLLLSFIAILFSYSQTARAYAQTIKIEPNYPKDQNNLYERLIKDSLYSNFPQYVDANVRSVNISFEELTGEDDTFGLCPFSDLVNCKFKSVGKAQASGGKIQMTVCGAGKDALKGTFNIPLLNKTCNEAKDYFHEGQHYRLSLYENEKAEGFIGLAELYVYHSMPYIQVKPRKQKGATAIDVTLWGVRPGGDNKNNYQIEVVGVDNRVIGTKCVTVKDSFPTFPAGYQKDATQELNRGKATGIVMVPSGSASKDHSSSMQNEFPPGRYRVNIKERIHDSRPFNIREGCTGGYRYMSIPLRIMSSNSKTDSFVGRPGSAPDIDFDPDEVDASRELNLLEGARAVCADYDFENNRCLKVNTALGVIETTAPGFIKTIFQFVLMIAAFGAIIIAIYSGYILMTSAGNKERIAAARETITSAVVGLLFIIFSIVILEIIGVDILRIPGLAR